MQQHYLTKSFNIVTIFFCVVVLFISSKELFFTPLKFSKHNAFAAIGNIQNLRNTTKVKKYHHFSWNDAAVKGILNEKDLIFTLKDSQVEITLNQNLITLYEETMIQLESHDELEITKGNIEFTLSSSERPLKILLGNRTFILKSNKAKVKISHTQNNQASIAVTEGDLSLTLPENNKTIEIKPEQTLTFTEKSYKVSTSKLRCLYPINEKIVSEHLNHSVKFIGSLTEFDNAILKIATDIDFNNIIYLDDSFSGEAEKKLNPGKYFWKLENLNISSSAHSFELFLQTKQNLNLTPITGHNEITYINSTKVQFKWKSLYQENNYILHIFNSEGEIVFTKDVIGNSFEWATKKEGNFSWEIKAKTPYFLVDNRNPNTFTIIKEDYTKKEALVIELTKPDQVVEFKWKKNRKANYSLFELSSDSNFENIIVSKKLLGSNTKINFPKVGVFYWRSKDIDQSGNKSFNRPIKVLIKPSPPPTKPKKLPRLKLQVNDSKQKRIIDYFISLAYADAGGIAKLNWPVLSDAKLYEIEIYSDPKLKNRIKKINVKHSKYKWNVPRTGKFYWRYRYKDFWGRFSPYSDASELIISKKKIKKVTSKKNITKGKSGELIAPKLIIKEEKSKKGQLSLYYNPSLINYTHKSSNKFSIDGTAMNGLQTNYLYRLENYHHLNFNAQILGGMVYDDEKFLYQNFSAHYHYKLYGGFVNLGARVIRLPRYQVKNALPTYKDAILTSLIDVGAKYLWHEINLLTQVYIGFGKGSYFELSTSYQIYRQKAFSIKTQASVITSSFKDGEDKINSQQYQLAIGPQFTF